ncbi:hypothetical protein AVEN_96087-1 [Araneus ventricosus]|uniref:Uncharacterized protein n=1 Tax=Araneus ventricosus TaxID=182803 RepID=A0A4Y2B728_ARAVE|nr:hypothetical protein AVEN_96087-1 [Araneus ventricosus]
MSEEVRFHLNVMMNQQNCRYWASENLKELHERPLNRATSESTERCLRESMPISKAPSELIKDSDKDTTHGRCSFPNFILPNAISIRTQLCQ